MPVVRQPADPVHHGGRPLVLITATEHYGSVINRAFDFERLHRFLSLAPDLGIVVAVTLFSNTYSNAVWALNPLRDHNNKQGIGAVEWPEYTSLKNAALLERQLTYARKVIRETHGYDNIYYEICNEPGGGPPNHVTPAEVDAWQHEVGRAIRQELAKLKAGHMVFGAQAFSYTPKFTQPLDASFADDALDAVNVHPLPNTILGGRPYDLGNFMSKELNLVQLRDFCLAAARRSKACVLDEDNCATLYRDEVGWTIHRKRAWTAVLCGAHYDFIDFSINVGRETGTPESNRKIRTWMRHLSVFIHSLDFVHARPAPDWIERRPDHLVVSVLARPGAEYVAYLADDREVTEPTAGRAIRGEVSFHLPTGRYHLYLYSPATGLYSPGLLVNGGDDPVTFDLPAFRQDLVLRATRVP